MSRAMVIRTILSAAMAFLVSAWSVAETKVSQELDFGYQKVYQSTNESYFEKYGEVPDGAVLNAMRFDVTTDSTTVSFEGQNVLQNNQSYDLNYNYNYKYKVDASWDEMPHVYSNTGRTLYTETSPGVYELPDSIQTALTGLGTGTSVANATTFNNALRGYYSAAHPVDLSVQHREGAVNTQYALSERMKVDLDFSEKRAEGYKPLGTPFGRNYAVELPQPVDYKTYNMRAGTQYNNKDVQVGLSYALSSFENEVDALTWDSAKRLTDAVGTDSAGAGASRGRMSLAPDNMSHQFALTSGFNLPARTRFTAEGSMNYMRQNQDLLPFTINSALTTAALEESKANTEMVTYTQDYNLSNAIWKPLTLALRYHSEQLVNHQSEVEFDGASWTDNLWDATPEDTTRFQYNKQSLEGSADWTVAKALSVGLKYGTEWDHRTHREVRDTSENKLTASMDLRPSNWMLLRGMYIHALRHMDDFDYNNLIPFEPPGLRRYDVSDRNRNQGNVLFQVTPGPISLALNGALTHDQYQPGKGDLAGGDTTNNQTQWYGLVEDRVASAGADLDWDISSWLGASLYYQYHQDQGVQRSNRSTSPINQDAPNDWEIRLLDRYNVVGVTTDLQVIPNRLDVRLGYELLDEHGTYNYVYLGSANSTKVSPTESKTQKQDATIRMNLKLTKSTTLALGYLYEQYQTSDWQYQNIPLVSGEEAGQTNIFLGTNRQNYYAHVGSILIKYKWGGAPGAS